MAAKPGTVFTWGANLSYADPTQVLDISGASNFDTGNPWTDDGVAPDNFFAHEYANYTFKLISDWMTYLDDLDITQVRVGTNGATYTLDSDSPSTVQVSLDLAGGLAVHRTDIHWSREGLALGLDGTTYTVAVGPQDDDSFNSRLVVAHNQGTGQAAVQADTYRVNLDAASANATMFAVSARLDESLYRDNLVKMRARVVFDGPGSSVYIEADSALGYNIDPAFKDGGGSSPLDGNTVRIPAIHGSEVLGHVVATVLRDPGSNAFTPDIAFLTVSADWDAANERVTLTPLSTSTADLTTAVPVVDLGAYNPGAMGSDIYFVDILVF